MVGPKLKYNYKIAYTVESSTTHVEYVNDNTPFGVNIATGVGVSTDGYSSTLSMSSD